MRFVSAEHVAIFKCTSQIYIEAMSKYNISGLVFVILVEDEIKVKAKV